MGQHYDHFSALERNVLQHQLNLGRSQVQSALALGRSRSTVSREVRRNTVVASSASGSSLNYDAGFASKASFARRRRGLVRLAEGSLLRASVFKQIRLGLVSATDFRQVEAYAQSFRSTANSITRDNLSGDLCAAAW